MTGNYILPCLQHLCPLVYTFVIHKHNCILHRAEASPEGLLQLRACEAVHIELCGAPTALLSGTALIVVYRRSGLRHSDLRD